MKYEHHQAIGWDRYVAPRLGAWIEIDYDLVTCGLAGVAPRLGAWIKTRQPAHPSVGRF